ncbi:hypothetical protein ACEV75_18380 [Vibrio parahaemolyticus]
MKTEVVFYTQVFSIVGFVIALFAIYRSLASQKDATIELLREQLKSRDITIQELKALSPNELAKSLSDRVDIMMSEIKRLRSDDSLNQDLINKKESELALVRAEVSKLSGIMEEYNLVCPSCSSPLLRRDFHTVYGYCGDKEMEADIEYVEFECGLSMNDGSVTTPCENAP